MTESRRTFLKRAAVASTVVAVGTIGATASTSNSYSSNGVIVGKSSKKEIIYKKTKAWYDYYRSAL